MQEIIQVDKQEALQTLNKIDDLMGMAEAAVSQAEVCFIDVSFLLVKAKQGAYWIERGLQSEQEYIEKVFPQSRAQYYTFIRFGTYLSAFDRNKLKSWGRAKCEDLVRLVRHFDGEVPPEWMEALEQDSKDVFRQKVKEFFEALDGKDVRERKQLGDEHVENEYVTIKLFGNGIHTYRLAIETGQKMVGSDKSDSHVIEMILANFLSQFAEDGTGHVMGKNAFILSSVEGLVKQLDLNVPDTSEMLIGIVAKGIEQNSAT